MAIIDPLTGQERPVNFSNDEFPVQPPLMLEGNYLGGFGNWIIAGDGYAYVPYEYAATTSTNPCGPSVGRTYLALLRVGTGGDASSIPVGAWDTYQASCTSSKHVLPTAVNLITNADQGVTVTWGLETDLSSEAGFTTTTTYYVATTATTSGVNFGGSSLSAGATSIPGEQAPVRPVLQRTDGSYIGTVLLSNNQSSMVAFTSSGTIVWSVSNDSPQIAIAGGGVIGASGITYDSNGKATGQVGNLPVQSWTGNAYQYGSIEQMALTQPDITTSFAALNGGNPSTASPGPQNLLPAAPDSPAGTYIPSLNAIYRAQVATDAKSYVGNSDNWNEAHNGGTTTCNLFVRDILNQASTETQLNIPAPVRNNLLAYRSPSTHPFLAKDWANSSYDGKCWKPLPSGPAGALPGDIIATGWPPNGNDGTGHVGVVVEPNAGAPKYKDASAADVAPYWWTQSQKASFIPGTITLTDYGFRLPGFDFTNPSDVQGLKQDSHVRRFSCY